MSWAEPWGRLGLWLTLWDDDAQPVIGLPNPNAFWEMLRTSSDRFHDRLRHLARSSLTCDSACVEFEPCSGVFVLSLPMVYRQRAVGCVLACAVTPSFLDNETLPRFCSLHHLDELVCRRLLIDLPTHSQAHLPVYAQILQNQVEALNGQVQGVRDVRSLSSHLAQAYEELNLIYRVSSNLTVLKRPAIHFEEVCSELLDVCVVQGFAAVIETSDPAAPEVVRIGPVSASEEDILRLYQQVRTLEPNAGEALVLNNVRDDPSLTWASGWLQQLIFFRLARNERVHGGLLALNHSDEREFGSEEIQLINAVAERSAAFLENVRLYEDLEQLFMGMLHALVSSIDAKDPYTCGHSQRVAWLSRHIAERLELTEAQCRRVYLSGLLHDVGKIGISEGVLRKTGRLSEKEFSEMKKHPEIGARILQGVRQIEDVIPGVLHHHERYDGHGYPFGLAGERISLLGRIIGLADSFDAMTTSRTYRTAHPVQIAIAEVRRWSGTQFDPHLVDLLLRDDLGRLLHVMGESDKQALARNQGFISPSGMEGHA